MKANNYISKREHKLILAVALSAFIFSIAGSVIYTIKADIKRNANFQEQEENAAKGAPVFSEPYCYPDKHPQFLFSIILLLGLTFSSLCISKRFLLSSLFTIISLSRFVYWYSDTQKSIFYNEWFSVKGFDLVLYNAGDFDIAVLVLTSILLFWQISILLRMLVKTLQTDETLP